MRFFEAVLILPVSLLAALGLWMVLRSSGEPHITPALMFVSIGGFVGLASLWVALFCRSSCYERNPHLAAALLAGVLLGCAVSLSMLADVERLADVAIALPPLLVAAHHVYLMGNALWRLHSVRKAAGDA